MGGFDCILGNPPYLGGKKINNALGSQLLNYIHYSFRRVGGQADLVTYFLRRTYNLIGVSRVLGLIVTNTISEGDTRVGGLDVVVEDYGTINFAIRSIKWPALANLFVSLICIHKRNCPSKRYLNGKQVSYINSYFDTTEEIGSPYVLSENTRRMFRGIDFGGDGFILKEGEAEMLIRESDTNRKVICKIINGSEVNTIPNQEPKRFIINFYDWTEQKSKYYPSPFTIVEQRVKPYRDCIKDKAAKKNWWLYNRNRPKLYGELSKISHCFVTAFTSKHLSFSRLDTQIVFSNALNIIATDDFSQFSLLHSNIHEMWVRKYASRLKNDLRYTPSDCFETFAFPKDIKDKVSLTLESLGWSYHEFRRQLMLKIQLGLTKTYNQFHNPDLREFSEDDISKIPTLNAKESQKQYGKNTVTIWKHLDKTEGTCSFNEAVRDIIHLRELHKHMDETVLRAYGWHEESKYGPGINLAHDFYEVDYLPENDRVRYTISPEARKEILKRLLLLNHEIYKDEVRRGLHDKKKAKRGKGRTKAADPKQIEINIQ